MTITPDDLVRREVCYCASQLISELSRLIAELPNECDLHDQVYEIAAPLPDYEEAARDNGWELDETECDYVKAGSDEVYNDLETLCECESIDPYDYPIEIYEHWIVSDWLADKLKAKGEAIAKDLCGLTIWGRTTTGQAIAMDAVIEEICADLNNARGGVPLYDPEGKLDTAKGLTA